MPKPSSRGVLLVPRSDDEETRPVAAKGVLALLGSLRPGRSWATRAQNLYIAAFAGAVLIASFWSISKRAGSMFVDVATFYDFLWGAPAILLLFLGAFRYSTVQGFVSFTEADCLHILPAPLRRRDLVLPRLATAAVLLGVVGALGGLVAGLESAGVHSGASIGGAALAGFALGVLVVAGSWHVQRLRWASRWVLRLTLPALGLIILLALAETSSETVRRIALWSGPWGWAFLAEEASGTTSGTVALLLLCALALAGGISLFRTAGHCSIEGFRVRARTRSQAVASLYALDYRSAHLAGRESKTRMRGGRMRLHLPRRPVLIVPWHGGITLLRSPVRLGWGVVLAGAGMVLLAVQPTQIGSMAAGAVALYLAASSLLEPLRMEVDAPRTPQVLLPWRLEQILWLHCLLPAALMIVPGFLALAGGLALGYLSGPATATVAILVIPLSFVVTLAAALSARQGGRVSNNVVNMVALDTTGFSWIIVLLQLTVWAIAGIAVTVLTIWLLGKSGLTIGLTLAEAVGLLSVLAVALQRALVAQRKA